MSARRTRGPSSRQTTLRHVWLAGLGAIAVSRREVLAAPIRLADRAGTWSVVARRLVEDVRSRVRDEVQPQVAELGAKAEARLKPVLERFGLIEPLRTPREAARKARRPQGRRSVAPTVKRTARKG
jgi:hypothetical protein